MDIEGNVRCGIVQRASRSGLAKTALRASTLTALALLIALAVLLPNAAAEAQTSPVSTATATATATPTDYDADNDGLIEINNLAQLNAVRHDLDGDGKQGSVSATSWVTYTSAFPNPASGMGCKPTDHDDDTTTAKQPTCDGYELIADLDFDTDGDGDVDSSDTGSYPNWTPIGTAANKFDAVFEGSLTNGVMPKISNLTISGSSSTAEVGLFGATGSNAHIENVGLVDVNVDVTASALNSKIGALVGNNEGKVIACYSTGKISAGAGAYPYAGGLVASNIGTISAAFSRATVYMASGSEIYVGGLAGYNGGTITATYSAGAVKGKGNSNSFVGGLVGYNDETITASYSIAPVTSVATTANARPPSVLGLAYNSLDPTNRGTITASYWDYITSGIDDDADRLMPEGKTTYDLMAPTSASGIYADWDDLTVDSTSDVDPWDFSGNRQHPLLTYGGHTTDLSGNQLFMNVGIDIDSYINKSSANHIHPREGMTLRAYGPAFAGRTLGPPLWQSSTDGITWSNTPVASICSVQHGVICGPAYRAAHSTYAFVPRPEHEGKYIRARVQLKTGGYAYTRVIGNIRAASTTDAIALSFTYHNPPRIGTGVVGVESLPSSAVWRSRPDSAEGLWQRCDTNGSSPSGCEYVGSFRTYLPGAADLGHYLRAHIYYMSAAGVWTRSTTPFTQPVVDGIQRYPWR